MCETTHCVRSGDSCGGACGEEAKQWSVWWTASCWKCQPQSVPLCPPCATTASWSTAAFGVQVPEQERGSKENKWDSSLTDRETDVYVCECHTQCVSHKRCASRSWQDKIHPWYHLWKSFLCAIRKTSLRDSRKWVLWRPNLWYSSYLLSPCSWFLQVLGPDPPRTSYSRDHISTYISLSLYQRLSDG